MGMKVQCFRVSHGPNGKGMYQGPDTKAAESMYEQGHHPCPGDDAALGPHWQHAAYGHYNREYFFGFKSLDQLRQWIYKTEWRQELHEAGYEIHIWEGRACLNTTYLGNRDNLKGIPFRPYIQGDTQMVFVPWHFTCTDSITLISV